MVRMRSFGDACTKSIKTATGMRITKTQLMRILLLGGRSWIIKSANFRVSQVYLLRRCKDNFLSLILLKLLMGYVANTYKLLKST